MLGQPLWSGSRLVLHRSGGGLEGQGHLQGHLVSWLSGPEGPGGGRQLASMLCVGGLEGRATCRGTLCGRCRGRREQGGGRFQVRFWGPISACAFEPDPEPNPGRIFPLPRLRNCSPEMAPEKIETRPGKIETRFNPGLGAPLGASPGPWPLLLQTVLFHIVLWLDTFSSLQSW